MRKYGLLAATLLLSAQTALSGCAVGDDYARPSFDLPQSWPWEQSAEEAKVEAEQAKIPLDWWTLFNDPTLTALVEEGHKANSDLLIAAARVSQARAVLGATNTDLYPDIDLQGGFTRTSRSQESTVSGFPTTSKPYNTFSLGAVLNYELDLWGRIRRASESARAQLLSIEANRDAVRLALSSDIASGYFNLLALDEQIRVTEDTIKAREEAFGYQNKQYDAGIVNELTYRQAESELAFARATLPTLAQARVEQESALAVLLGRSPREIIEGGVPRADAIAELPVPPALPSEMPSTLLERRPDIYAAEQQLVSANADIGVAKADYFPRVSLSALIGLASSDADRLLRSSARQWDAGTSITQPLLDIPRVGYNVDRTRAFREEATEGYRQTVRMAFKDVLDAMSAQETSTARVEALALQTNSLSESLRVSTLRYDAGYSTYLEKLDAQRNFYQAQLSSIEAQRDRLTASVNLYKAIGGGWANPEETAKAAEEPTTVVETTEEVVITPVTEPAEEVQITIEQDMEKDIETAPSAP